MKRIITLTLAIFALCSALPAQERYNSLASTPQMGWNSWNCFHCDIDEDIVRTMADAMVESGLRDAGYIYLNLDDCWHGMRDSLGFIHCDPEKFPSGIEALADYVHSLGLKLGIYSDAGTNTCGGRPGSLGHEYQDAITYASWGIDYLKYDWCYTPDINARGAYKLMSDALRSTGREIFFSMCEWGTASPWEWAAPIANSWRTTGDIGLFFDIDEQSTASWENSIMTILDKNEPLRRYAAPGHWNDPDMLEVGNGLSVNKDRAHFTLWAIMNAPLLLGNDIRTMSAETRAIILNKDVIALNQDALGVQALRYRTDENGVEYWFKPLADGCWAVCLFNRSHSDATVTVDWAADYCLADTEVSGLSTSFDTVRYDIFDLWASKKAGTTARSKTVLVPAQDVVLYRLTPRGK